MKRMHRCSRPVEKYVFGMMIEFQIDQRCWSAITYNNTFHNHNRIFFIINSICFILLEKNGKDLFLELNVLFVCCN